MADGLTLLRKAQIGIEVTKGTAVPATAVLLPVITMENTPQFFRPKEERGAKATQYRTVKVGDLAALTMAGDVTFEQILYPLHMGVLGGLSPTTVDTSAKLWTFTPAMSTAGTYNSFTIEHGDNLQEWEVEFCMAKTIEFTFAMNDVVKFKADLFGRQMTATTFTGALTAPTVETAIGQKTKISIDAAGGTMGATELAATLVNGTFSIDTGLSPKRYGDGSTLFSGYNEAEPSAKFKGTLWFNTALNAERAYFDGSTQRLLRIKTEGSKVGSISALKYLQCDMSGVWTKWAPIGEKDGGDVFDVEMECERGGTYTKLFEIAVENAVTALP